MSTIAQIRKHDVFGRIDPPNLREIQRADADGNGAGQLRRYRLGVALLLASIGMVFVGFSSAYVVRRGIPTYDAASGAYSLTWEPLQLPVRLLLVNTLLLIAASFAVEVARKSARAKAGKIGIDRGYGWMHLAAALVASFLLGQVSAWHQLRADGHLVTSGAHAAFFCVITAAHAFHALLGVTAAGWIALRARLWSTMNRYFATDLAAWYLHSMTVLWICLFAFLVFA